MTFHRILAAAFLSYTAASADHVGPHKLNNKNSSTSVVVALNKGKGNHSGLRKKTSTRKLQAGACLTNDEEMWELYLPGTCEDINEVSGSLFVEFLNEILQDVECEHGARTELKRVFGTRNPTTVLQMISSACTVSGVGVTTNNPFDFRMVNEDNKSFVWLEAFFDGGTDWNNLRETIDMDGETINILEEYPGEAIDFIMGTVAHHRPLEFPEQISNFDGCEIRTAMCCWVQDRQANDDNGNCEEPYDEECVDADPADNTDICYVDMARAPGSARVEAGVTIFEEDTEGETHCHGFVWSDDETTLSNQFKGNNLFYVSMYDHLYQRGYVKNVPGAPMCACLEQMPVVSRSDCTQVDKEGYIKILKDSGGLAVTEHEELAFNACEGLDGEDNDLLSHFELLVEDGEASEEEFEVLLQTIVGEENCDQAVNDDLRRRRAII